jgi:glc operon protein GlcG
MTTKASLKLTYEGARVALDAAVAKATEMGVPQDITIVDDGGHLLAFARMDGAKLLSIDSSQAKALSAASHRQPTNRLHVAEEVRLAFATGGKLTNLKGGLPIVIDGHCVGAIGVGSGTGDQDVEVARAGLAALGARDFPPADA